MADTCQPSTIDMVFKYHLKWNSVPCVNYTSCVHHTCGVTPLQFPISRDLVLPTCDSQILFSRMSMCVFEPHGLLRNQTLWHRYHTRLRFFPPTSTSMKMWTMVAITISMETKGFCLTHLFLRFDLLQHPIRSLNVMIPPRPGRSII